MKRGRAVNSLYWAYAASKFAHGTEIHPLCKTMEENKDMQLAKLPALFTCHEDGDGKARTCSPTKVESDRRALAGTSSIRLASVNEKPTGESAGHAAVSWITESTASSTWLICAGTRDGTTQTATEARSWVDCRGYFAVNGTSDNPSELCQKLRRPPQEKNAPSTDLPTIESKELLPGERQNADTVLSVEQSAQAELGRPRVSSDQKPHTWRKTTEQRRTSGVVGTAFEDEQVDAEQRVDLFVNLADDKCDALWTSWPAVQEEAIARGTFLVFDLFPSIGNLFNTLHDVIKIARLLEVAVILNWQGFEGFRVAFDPAEIMWDLDSSEILERAEQFNLGPNPANLHSLKFHDGVMILSDSQLELLAQGVGIAEPDLTHMAKSIEELFSEGLRLLLKRIGRPLTPPQPCAWNIFLRRSASMMLSLAEHSAWMQPADSSGHGPLGKDYVAWHIRTSAGETERSFDPAVHKHVFHKQPSSMVCSLYFSATDEAKETCSGLFPDGLENLPIYVSSNSQSMSRNCTSDAADLDMRAGFVDLGLADSDAHTKFSKNPTATAVKALVDYLFLMDAAMIVRTKSSFSGTVAKIKGLECSKASTATSLDISGLKLCMPAGC